LGKLGCQVLMKKASGTRKLGTFARKRARENLQSGPIKWEKTLRKRANWWWYVPSKGSINGVLSKLTQFKKE